MENLKDENSLGEKLKFYRCRDGMTQEYVAKKIGVSRQAVSKWETDAVEPSTANIIALSNLFDISSLKFSKLPNSFPKFIYNIFMFFILFFIFLN